MKHSLASMLIAGATLLPGPLGTPAHAATMILHSFAAGDGAHPYGSLALSGSKLYGMTNDGPTTADSRGTLFSVNTDGTGFSVLHSFVGGSTDRKTH